MTLTLQFVIFFIVSITLFIVALILFYKRSTKEISFVRTGFGGEKVIINGGAWVLPTIHNVIKINMKTIEINLLREKSNSLLTCDHLRVDICANFFLRVYEGKKEVSLAAQTLGSITHDLSKMTNMFEERCEAALSAVVGHMKMSEIHSDRQRFRQEIMSYIEDDLKGNGLFLQSIALTHLNQTERAYFNEDNAFDSEGLTRITQRIAENEVKRAEAEAKKQINIREREFNAEKDRIEYEERLVKEEEEKRQRINDFKQKAEKEIEFSRIIKEKDIALFQQEKDRLIAEGQREVAEAWIITDQVKAEAAKMAESITTAKDTAEAERNKIVAIVNTKREAARQRILSEVDFETQKQESESAAIRYKVEAEGKESINTAMNILSSEQVSMQIKTSIIDNLPEIVKQSVKPIENIDSIKILQVDGLNSIGQGGSESGSNGHSSLPDQIVNSSLKYRAQAPLVESLLQEVGLKGSNINDMTKALTDDVKDSPSNNE